MRSIEVEASQLSRLRQLSQHFGGSSDRGHTTPADDVSSFSESLHSLTRSRSRRKGSRSVV